MTNDLPARLREASTYALMDAARATVLEAADEIERLRRILGAIERFTETGSVFEAMFGDVRKKRQEAK